ncbi:MAG: ABC transporter ATP-binding protein [Sporolactobacillus sp.]|jgi:energy-coupling factor transport system ATP-binding protein|nr:ABC transporter ATP-binding protein [Sporolactobacillus sp.]
MIRFDHVSFTYAAGRRPAVRNLTLTVDRGECVVVTGRSGCGKTTLTRLVNGLTPRFFPGTLTGTVHIGGRQQQAQPIWSIGWQVGSVLQDPGNQFFAEKTGDEIAFGCENYGVPRDEIKKRVAVAARRTGSTELLNRSLFDLSSGQQQQVAIASIAALNPEIYVFDEPSANLDSAAARRLQQLMLDLKAAGKTLLVAEHRLFYLTDIADRFLYMENGTLTHRFSPAEMQAMSAGEREALGLRAVNLPPIPAGARTNATKHREIDGGSAESRRTPPGSEQADTAAQRGVCGRDTSYRRRASVSTQTESGRKTIDGRQQTDTADKMNEQTRTESLTNEHVIVGSPSELTLRSINFSYHRRSPVLRNINLALHSGEVAAVTGANGAGKTTLARLICGLLREQSGQVLFRGKPVRRRKRRDYTFFVMRRPDSQLFCESGLAEVRSGGHPAQAESLLACYHLQNLAERHPATFSGGQKLRLLLAVAEARDPAILLLDEPTSGLDGENMRRVARRLRQRADSGKTVLVITHDREFIAAACTRILHMKNGTVDWQRRL